ncbi:MAG: hypothetical protein RIC89_21045, partial [Pseudomonadales bacterium]
LPRDKDASPLAVEADSVQYTLQLAVEHAAGRQFDASMWAAIMNGMGDAVLVAPHRDPFA